jgi:hypothetical protein
VPFFLASVRYGIIDTMVSTSSCESSYIEETVVDSVSWGRGEHEEKTEDDDPRTTSASAINMRSTRSCESSYIEQTIGDSDCSSFFEKSSPICDIPIDYEQPLQEVSCTKEEDAFEKDVLIIFSESTLPRDKVGRKNTMDQSGSFSLEFGNSTHSHISGLTTGPFVCESKTAPRRRKKTRKKQSSKSKSLNKILTPKTIRKGSSATSKMDGKESSTASSKAQNLRSRVVDNKLLEVVDGIGSKLVARDGRRSRKDSMTESNIHRRKSNRATRQILSKAHTANVDPPGRKVHEIFDRYQKQKHKIKQDNKKSSRLDNASSRSFLRRAESIFQHSGSTKNNTQKSKSSKPFSQSPISMKQKTSFSSHSNGRPVRSQSPPRSPFFIRRPIQKAESNKSFFPSQSRSGVYLTRKQSDSESPDSIRRRLRIAESAKTSSQSSRRPHSRRPVPDPPASNWRHPQRAEPKKSIPQSLPHSIRRPSRRQLLHDPPASTRIPLQRAQSDKSSSRSGRRISLPVSPASRIRRSSQRAIRQVKLPIRASSWQALPTKTCS